MTARLLLCLRLGAPALLFAFFSLARGAADDIEGGGFGPPRRAQKNAANTSSPAAAENHPLAPNAAPLLTAVDQARPTQSAAGAQHTCAARPLAESPNCTGILRLTIAVNGKPGAARLVFRDASGKALANLPGLPGGWAEGNFFLRLPAGFYNVTALSGPRTFPWQGAVEVRPNSEVHCNVDIPVYGSISGWGWRLCDPYVEIGGNRSASEHFPSTFDDLLVAARGEGLEIAGFADLWDLLAPQGVEYGEMASGQDLLAQVLRQCGESGFLGLAAASESDVDGGFFYTISPAPLRPRPECSLRARLAEISDHGGMVIIRGIADRIYGSAEKGRANEAAAFLLHLLTGPVFQAIDVGGDSRDLEIWQALLQTGYRLPAIAGGPEQIAPDGSNMPAPGFYALLPAQADKPDFFFEAMHGGRIIASNGPFIRLLIDGAGVGDAIPPSAAPRQVLIEALASSYNGDDVDEIELIYNGESVGKWEGAASQKGIRIRAIQEFPAVGWIVAHYRSRRRDLWAFTNPIYVQSGRLGTPPPIAGDLTIFLRDRETAAAVSGAVEVWSAGAPCASYEVAAAGQRIAVPFGAMLRIAAPGYATKDLWLAEEQSLRNRLAEILAARPPDHWLEPETMQDCRMALANLTLTVSLERDAAAAHTAEAEIGLSQGSAVEDANHPGLPRQ